MSDSISYAAERAPAKRTHRTRTPMKVCWENMLRRCSDPKLPAYKWYGARGIKVCERWRVFDNFLADMGERPSPAHSLDRFPNNDGDYEPGNCRWATNEQQMNNKRSPARGSKVLMDLQGRRFGRLVVTAFSRVRDKPLKQAMWMCRCDCGTEKEVSRLALVTNKTVSCGCLLKELRQLPFEKKAAYVQEELS